MSYAYFPPRLSNYAPRGMPYLAGLGIVGASMSKLTYQQDHDNWLTEKATYAAAYKAWQIKMLSLRTKYATAVKAYNKQLATWNADYQAYLSALDTYNTQYAGIKRDNSSRSQATAKSYGITLPQSYFDNGACLTQAQHDAYAGQCTTVKGIMGLGSLDPDCGYAKLPICAYPAPPSIRPAPLTPAPPAYPAAPTLRAEPQPPSVKTQPGYTKVPPPAAVVPPAVTPDSGGGGGGAPAPTPDTTPDAIEPHDPKQAGMLMNGLILVAILGGGYLVYRTIKKPKAAA